jgi:phosphoesterase RecJ-like protein
VIDHHAQTEGISFATVTYNETAVATSEIIYKIAKELDWPLPLDALEMMATSIMSDSLGLVSEATTVDTFRIMTELVGLGVSLATLDHRRRLYSKKDPVLIPYKGVLLQRVAFDSTGRIATVSIPWEEIVKFSPLYNPSMLVLDDMRMVVGVEIAIAFKIYNNGTVTGKVRCNFGSGIAGKLAAQFGGGGHAYAAGFKLHDVRDTTTLQSEVCDKANELLDLLNKPSGA